MSQTDATDVDRRGSRGTTELDVVSKSKQNAVRFFLDHAPPCELKETLEDCELLVDNPSALSNRFIQSAVDVTYESVMDVVQFSHDSDELQAVLCKAGKVAPSQYLYPRLNLLLNVSYSEGIPSATATPAPASALNTIAEPYRRAVEKIFQSYVEEEYSCGKLKAVHRSNVGVIRATAVYADAPAPPSTCEDSVTEPVHNLTAVMSVKMMSKGSSWNSTWMSEWKFSVSANDDHARNLSGSNCVRIHLYEDANVHLKFERSFNASEDARLEDQSTHHAGTTHPEKVAITVLNRIKVQETAFIREVQDFCQNKASVSVAAARRRLSITRREFDWKQQSLQLQLEERY